MISGYVTKVIHHDDYLLLLLRSEERDSRVEVCRTAASLAIRPGDHIWSQAGWLMWSSQDYGIEDVKLNRHRTNWNGTHPCGCESPEVARSHQ